MPEPEDSGAEGAIVLSPGTLWPAVLARSARAVRRGALEPIPTDPCIVADGGVRFLVRLMRQPRRLPSARPRAANPFLPYDRDLFVAEISGSHVCLLNKYHVMDQHLLLVTREFEDQESPLTRRDFEALWACMGEFDALGFYNAGARAGASQRHRHLQLVPVPWGAGPHRVPMDSLLSRFPLGGGVGEAAGLPFRHALAWLRGCAGKSPERASDVLLELYGEMRRSTGWDREPRPYNLLLTRDWMLFVPRVQEGWHSVSVNALGFAGALLVADREQLQHVRACGPMSVLRHVAAAR